MLVSVIFLAIIGLLISIYAYIVEQKMKRDVTYKPACDLSDHISCSKPINSRYGKVFGVTNALVGIAFYITMIVLAALGMEKLVLFGSIAACVASVVFAYILLVKVRAFCVVCFSIYAVNALLLWAVVA